MSTADSEPMGVAAMAGLLHQMRMREAIASVALSHNPSCTCDVCKAAQGDDSALIRVMDASR